MQDSNRFTDGPFLVDTREQIMRSFYSKFLFSDAIKKQALLTRLLKLDVLNRNVQKRNVGGGFESIMT